ncbi:Beta-xylosidase, GH43 family [Paenibacillus algorifonticola]|uniref:Beta-xylosidase, GH43 family n=1 Tax=Paenibacillus algorifonticola TaxID=684063 RepID=A0A1I2AAR0_9BACL|nr:family 43 glycosylhydrolase [Paenibacillus algorifonticola]SFE41135.1 Beta-xylosidase, GH43 family [Paenibacillus algorifonticola]
MKDAANTVNKQLFPNPFIEQRADPWIYRHADGYYYFTASVPEFDRIELRRAKVLTGLAESTRVVVWTKPSIGPMSALIWAPEIHFIEEKWYIYFAAAPSEEIVDGLFNHRMFVLENASSNPLEGKWTEKGQIHTAWDTFALDATSFSHKGKQYLVWAQKAPHIAGNSNLYISELENPWTLRGEQVLLTKPEFSWEIIGFKVNEGPAVLSRNGKLFITYSASATDHHYCLGLLTADADCDPLDAAAWSKSPQPVFQTSERTRQYGPGHNCFTVAEDELEDVLVYHARSYKEIVGNPLYDPNRHARLKKIDWDEDGNPVFGEPAADDPS